MHKRLLLLIVSLLVGLFFITSIFTETTAESSSDLLTATNLDVQKGNEVVTVPSSLNGNIDCIKDGPYDCVIDTSFGKFSNYLLYFFFYWTSCMCRRHKMVLSGDF